MPIDPGQLGLAAALFPAFGVVYLAVRKYVKGENAEVRADFQKEIDELKARVLKFETKERSAVGDLVDALNSLPLIPECADARRAVTSAMKTLG